MPPSVSSPAVTPQPSSRRDGEVLKKLLPYFWQYRWRVALALGFMLGAKLATVGVPLLLKKIVDQLDAAQANPLFVLPVGLLVAYGALRLCTSLFTELRELVFAKATEGAARAISLQVFRHLHLDQLNPRIRLSHTPISIPTSAQPWPRGARARVAGISSFGLSGTNAHVLVGEPPMRSAAAIAPTSRRQRTTKYSTASAASARSEASSTRMSCDRPDRPSRPDRRYSRSVTSGTVIPIRSMRYSTTPGSSCPQRVPIGNPSSAENPMVEATERPP